MTEKDSSMTEVDGSQLLPHRPQQDSGSAGVKKRQWTAAQEAGWLCTIGSFQRFLYERDLAGENEGSAANYVRYACGVKSRSEIDNNPEALRRFRVIVAEYNMWMRGDL